MSVLHTPAVAGMVIGPYKKTTQGNYYSWVVDFGSYSDI